MAVTTIEPTFGGVLGRQTLYIPAAAMTSAATNGAEAGTVEEGTNDINYATLDFDASTDEYAEFNVAFPKGYDLTAVRYRVFWRSTAADTDGVSWGLRALSRADNETIDAAWGTGVVIDDANQSSAGELLVSAESTDVTTSAADDDLVFFRLYRDVSDSNDTATEDAQLIGIQLFYDIDAGTDD